MSHEMRNKERERRSYQALKYTMVITGAYDTGGVISPVDTGHEATEQIRITKKSKLRYRK